MSNNTNAAIDKPLSELSNSEQASHTDLILISRYLGDVNNFVSRNLEISVLEDFIMSVDVRPEIKAAYNSLSTQISTVSTFLSDDYFTYAVQKSDANYESTLTGYQYFTSLSEKDGVVNATTGNMYTCLGMTDYVKWQNIECDSVVSPNHYVSGLKIDRSLPSTTENPTKVQLFQSPLSTYSPSRTELTYNIQIPTNKVVSGIAVKDGKAELSYQNGQQDQIAPDGKYVKAVKADTYGKVKCEYGKLPACDFNGVNDQYMTGLKIAADGTVTPTYKNLGDYWPMAQFLDALYPIGAIYISTTVTCPLTAFNSVAGISWKWQRIQDGEFLENTNPVKSHIAPGLPTLAHSHDVRVSVGPSASGSSDKAHHGSGTCGHGCTGSTTSTTFARSDIYGKSNTVQPKAYAVSIWERIA